MEGDPVALLEVIPPVLSEADDLRCCIGRTKDDADADTDAMDGATAAAAAAAGGGTTNELEELPLLKFPVSLPLTLET